MPHNQNVSTVSDTLNLFYHVNELLGELSPCLNGVHEKCIVIEVVFGPRPVTVFHRPPL